MPDFPLHPMARDAAPLMRDALARISRVREDFDVEAAQERVAARLTRHLTFISNWSERTQIYGMGHAFRTAEDTIPLHFTDLARRFRGSRTPDSVLDEDWLLDASEDVLLIGDPGAGKTTTLRRLSNALLSQDLTGSWSLPILIIARELKDGSTLKSVLFETLGIDVSFRASDRPVVSIRKEEHETSSEFERRRAVEQELLTARIEAENQEVADREESLFRILEETRATIVVDGLDELPEPRLRVLESELIELRGQLSNTRIVASCRSGSYLNTWPGFHILEILPLSRTEAELIVDVLVSDAADFWAEVGRSQIEHLTNRPLILTQMALLYEGSGSLPERPASLCRDVVDLVLKRWDSQRRIERPSRYSDFSADDKHDFLAHMAYFLTCRSRKSNFSEADLIAAFSEARSRFSLPENQAVAVAQEIESHTGLIVVAGHDSYEFSHLILQEYLCAFHLIRLPDQQYVRSYLDDQPEPIAVAVSLSSDPSRYLSDLFLTSRDQFTDRALAGFMARLAVERPRFSSSRVLGASILYMLEKYSGVLESAFERLITISNIRESVAEGLKGYRFGQELDHRVVLQSVAPPGTTVAGHALPATLTFETFTVHKLSEWGFTIPPQGDVETTPW
nr:AAA family ATPase [uncultured Nocardioides sp.]